jgi:CheY-like chemotaxis protein
MVLPAEAVSETVPEAPADGHSVRILIADDSPIDRRLAERLLTASIRATIVQADNGMSALRALEDRVPDLLLTDLNMPEMDGLELVETVRARYPGVPTILMTANGSEEIAIRALRSGAASYVAKRRLSAELVDTVQAVLSLSSRDRQHLRLNECWEHTEFEFSLGNDTTLVPILVQHLQRYLRSVRHCDETELVRVSVALNEALQNAVYHGNLELQSALRDDGSDRYDREAESRRTREPYASRRVRMSARESRDEARYVIRDEGPGFDYHTVMQEDPTSPENLTRPRGRGLFLIRTFMTEVRFNEPGNEITMIHRRDPRAAPHNQPR